jgi:hypothetical protein
VRACYCYLKASVISRVFECCTLEYSYFSHLAIRWLQGMLCSRGQLLLMLDADGASRITDLEKLEAQVSCRWFCTMLKIIVLIPLRPCS